MGEAGRKIVESEGQISPGPEMSQKPDLTQRMIDGAHFVRINSFQEYAFEAKRERDGLKLNNGYRFGSAEDKPHEEIRQIQSVVKRYGDPQESNWDEDKFGRLYVASYPLQDSWIIWGGGRIGKDFVGRPNNISFQIQLQDAELASEFMKAITENPTPTLQMLMSRVFVNEQGQQLLPTDRVKTQHRQYMDPFLVPIAEVKAVEIKKPESRPAVENRQPPVYNLTMSEAQGNIPSQSPEVLTPPERRYEALIAPMAEGRNDKVAAGKPQGREGAIARGGDDCAFSLKAPDNNPNGLICFGADLDGVSQGGRGDEASIVAAKSLQTGIEKFLNRSGQPLNRDQVAIEVAKLIAGANKQVFEEGKRMATTLSLFGLQESERQLYLHSWNTGDSVTMVYVQTENGQESLYPVTIPQDPIGEGMMKEKKFEDLYADEALQLRMQAPDNMMNIDRLQQAYRDAIVSRRNSLGQYGPEIVEQELVTVSNVVGFKPKAVVDYTRVSLPQIGEVFKGSPVKNLKVVAMSDGIENYSSFDQQLQALHQPTANGVAIELLRLGNTADADDRSVVVAEVRPRLTETSKPIKKESPAVKTEKEWRESMQNMLKDPIAQIVYLQTGSLPAAAVANEHRAEILSGKMTEEQYITLVKRVLSAGKA